MIEIRPFVPADAAAVSRLIQDVFDEHVAPSFEPMGIAGFAAYTSPEALAERAPVQPTLVACDGDRVVGVVQVRDGDHISLLFVRTSHTRRGIATALMDLVEADCRAAGRPALTVNSSLNAQSYYARLGFVAVAGPQRVDGFAFVPMEKLL